MRSKSRKRRTASLTRETVAVLRQWLTERQGQPEEPQFPTRQGRPLTRSGVGQLLAKHAATATVDCPSLKTGSPGIIVGEVMRTLVRVGV